MKKIATVLFIFLMSALHAECQKNRDEGLFLEESGEEEDERFRKCENSKVEQEIETRNQEVQLQEQQQQEQERQEQENRRNNSEIQLFEASIVQEPLPLEEHRENFEIDLFESSILIDDQEKPLISQ